MTTVVIPDQSGLPIYEQIPSVSTTVNLIMAASGRRPVYLDGAWVWTNVNELKTPILAPSAFFSSCSGAGVRGGRAVETAMACLTSSTPFVFIRNPTTGAVVHGDIFLGATVAAMHPVRQVDIVITGVDISGSLVVPAAHDKLGWLAGFNTTTLPNGVYSVIGVAHAVGGSTGRGPKILITVDNQ